MLDDEVHCGDMWWGLSIHVKMCVLDCHAMCYYDVHERECCVCTCRESEGTNIGGVSPALSGGNTTRISALIYKAT